MHGTTKRECVTRGGTNRNRNSIGGESLEDFHTEEGGVGHGTKKEPRRRRAVLIQGEENLKKFCQRAGRGKRDFWQFCLEKEKKVHLVSDGGHEKGARGEKAATYGKFRNDGYPLKRKNSTQ